MILKTTIEQLMRGEDLSAQTCQQVMTALLDPTTSPLQIAAFLVLLRAKGETAVELAAIVTALRQSMTIVPTPHAVLDIVGTGGDGLKTVNISTGSALLAASCGVKVAKHGNHSVSSLTGSADVLTALGVNIQLTPTEVAKCIDTIGIGFCYAPNFQPVLTTLRDLRKQLQVATTLNLLGPLLNPAQASHLVLGVADPTLLSTIATVLGKIGCHRAVLAHGAGMDEISTACCTQIIEINQQQTHAYQLDPQALGFTPCSIQDLRGGDAAHNAKLLLHAFQGNPSPIADTLILNAAVALYLYDCYPTILDAIACARATLASGAVLKLLNQWIELTHDYAQSA